MCKVLDKFVNQGRDEDALLLQYPMDYGLHDDYVFVS